MYSTSGLRRPQRRRPPPACCPLTLVCATCVSRPTPCLTTTPFPRRPTMTPIAEQLTSLGLRHTAANLDDLVAMSTKRRLGPLEIIELLVEREGQYRAKKSLERRLARSRIGRFKPMTDYEGNWPTRIDRDAIDACGPVPRPA